MNEGYLRWKGRIGGLRDIAVAGIVIGLIAACVSTSQVKLAMKNATGVPQEISIDQLLHDPDTGIYVEVSGYAIYEAGYEKTEDSRTIETYYFLVDPDTRSMILVKHDSPTTMGKIDGDATITGMIQSTPSELEKAVKADMSSYEAEEGLYTTETIYIADGRTPPTVGRSRMFLGASLFVVALCVVPFFFPKMAFAPCPVNSSTPSPERPPAVQASGNFQQLKSLEPLEIGKGTQRFNNAVANLIRRGPLDLVVYIHRVVRRKSYGITTGTQESDWAAFFNGENVQSIEAGKIYGWKDRWAMRIQYVTPKGKTRSFFIVFESAHALAGFVTSLQEMRFQVLTGASRLG